MKHIVQIDLDSPVMDQRKQIEAVIREWSRVDRFRHLEEVGRMLAKDQPAPSRIAPQGFHAQAKASRRAEFLLFACCLASLVVAWWLGALWITFFLMSVGGVAGALFALAVHTAPKLWKRIGAWYSK